MSLPLPSFAFNSSPTVMLWSNDFHTLLPRFSGWEEEEGRLEILLAEESCRVDRIIWWFVFDFAGEVQREWNEQYRVGVERFAVGVVAAVSVDDRWRIVTKEAVGVNESLDHRTAGWFLLFVRNIRPREFIRVAAFSNTNSCFILFDGTE